MHFPPTVITLQIEPVTFSTSSSRSVAEDFGYRQKGYLYEIRNTPAGINVNRALGNLSPFPHELEIAFPKSIPFSDILKWTPKGF